MALDFTPNDTLDMPVALHSLKGKYLLVDFGQAGVAPAGQKILIL